MSEFNLSEKEMIITLEPEHSKPMFYEEDVKEFIRLLKKGMRKEGYKETAEDINKIINKLAGSKLSGENLA